MNTNTDMKPFDNCPALDGYHCQTNALAKIFNYHSHPLSEDMILGLGAGMGFIYWKMKIGSGTYVFIGGRGNNKAFFIDIGKRTGVAIDVVSTSSAKKAEASLLEKMAQKEPVMLFGDMGFLPWFEFPQEYHFGGHTFVICGYDGKGTVLASDMEPQASGLKKGFYFPISMDQLRKARGSAYKPFPPKNAYLEFDFSRFHAPKTEDIYSAIKQTIEVLLNPPIKNLGIKGIRHTAKEILKWPNIFNDHDLRMNLFSLYIFFEIGGTGGGCFRPMYSRFLKESAGITKNSMLAASAEKIQRSGAIFTDIGVLFREAETVKDINDRIKKAGELFDSIADIEEDAFMELSAHIK
jgi:hypothetical protein